MSHPSELASSATGPERRLRIPRPWVMLCAALVLLVAAIYLAFVHPFIQNLSLVRKIHFGGGFVRFEDGRPTWLRDMLGEGLQPGLDSIVSVSLFPELDTERVTREVAAGLRQQHSVVALQLDLTDAELQRLDFPRITVLTLYASVTDAGIDELARFPTLAGLKLQESRISDAGMEHLVVLDRLERLELWSCVDVCDPGIERVCDLPALQSLTLVNCPRLTDESVRHIAALPRLHDLTLGACPLVTDEGLLHLKGSPVENLTIQNCAGLTASGLDHLSGISSLRSLRLTGWQYSDSAVPYLESMTQLVRLELRDTAVSESGANRLRTSLPDCEVVYRPGGPISGW